MTRLQVIEKATGVEMMAERIEGGFRVFTLDGAEHKKLKESTFKKYFKLTGETSEKKEESKAPQHQAAVVDEEKKAKMTDKIKKMMALAQNNTSEEEAIAAALHAQKLMAKYNINPEDLDSEELKDEITSIFSAQNQNSHLMAWRKTLAAVVATNFRCKAYIHSGNVVFRGYTEDAKLGLDIYLMLYQIGDKLGSEAYKTQVAEEGTGKGAYNSTTLGFLAGVREAFNEQCTALRLVVPQEVEKEFEEFSKGFKAGKSRSVTINPEQFQAGKEAGKRTVKSRSIETKN